MAEIKDRSWENVQQKAFTAWMNETLSQRNMHVNTLAELEDGVVLCNFFEILSGKKIQTKIETKPGNRIQKIQNLAIALKFLETDLGTRSPGCSAEDIVDVGSRGGKMVLGLLWTLYRKYRIAVITHQDKSAEEGLLMWCKNVTDGYKGVQIENFKTSFKDGLAFLALVHRFNPETSGVVFDNYSKDTPEQNLTAAFEFAEKELHVPKLLDVNEVMEGRVDERSLVLYTSLFFHAYTAAKVASDLEKARLGTEEILQSEKKRNEDLLRDKFELEARIEQLTLELKSRDTKLEEEATIQLQFKTKVESLESQVEQLTIIVKEREETNLTLDTAKKHKEVAYEELTLKFQTQEKDFEATKVSTSLKQTEDEKEIQELKKKHATYEEEIETLKNDIDNFKVQLENERKDKEDQTRVLTERTEQDGVHRKGLGVLRRNLDQHIEDLHTWQKYLDSKDKTFLDFDREVRPGLESELDGIKDFVGELNILSGKLDIENEAMLKILKAKVADAKAEEIKKAGTK